MILLYFVHKCKIYLLWLIGKNNMIVDVITPRSYDELIESAAGNLEGFRNSLVAHF